GLDPVGVERVAEIQLAGEHAAGTLGQIRRPTIRRVERTSFRLDGEDVAFHVDVDGVGSDAGKIERYEELVTVAVRVERHRRRAGPCADLRRSEGVGGDRKS